MYAIQNHTQWTLNVIDSSWHIGSYFSLILDTNDNPHVSYIDYSSNALKYASLNESNWTIETVSLNQNDGPYPYQALTLDHNNKPHIAFIDGAEHALKYATKTGTSWSIQTIANDSNGNKDTFTSPSIAIDAECNPHISYADNSKSPNALKYASWIGSAWSTQTVDYGEQRIQTSLVLDADDIPHISYLCWNNTSYQLQYADFIEGKWNIQLLDENASDPSLALDSTGNPHICYTQVNEVNGFFRSENLKYAVWTGSSWDINLVQANSWNPSLALDATSNPSVSFREDSNGGQGIIDEPLVYATYG